MHRSRLVVYLFIPSLTSGTLCVVLAAVVLGMFNWASLVRQAFFYDYFFGPDGLITALQGKVGSDSSVRGIGISSAVMNDIIILVAAVLVGASVLFAIETFRAARRQASAAYAA